MEIILKEDIIGLGYKNDIVTVKSGYGRNYLIPQGKGVIASESAKKVLAENLRQQAHKLAAQKAEAEKKAEALKDVALTIAVKVSATGVTYGSVGKAQVAEALKKLGHDIDRKIITMNEAKKLGDYVATVHFHKEVLVEIPVTVVDEKSVASAEAPAAKVEEALAVEETPDVTPEPVVEEAPKEVEEEKEAVAAEPEAAPAAEPAAPAEEAEAPAEAVDAPAAE